MDDFVERRGNTDAVGIIIQPGPQTVTQYLALFMTNPEELANLWGHTAMYVRQNGRVVRAVGFDPHRGAMVTDVVTGRVSGGRHPTTGYYYDERVMFRSPDALIVEFPITALQVVHLLATLPQFGRANALTHGHVQQQYLTRDGVRLHPRYGRLNPNLMGNCINFITLALTRANLVISASRPLTSRRTGALIAAPDYDMSPAQGQLTNVVVQSFRTPTLVLHDLATGGQVQPLDARRYLSRAARTYRRVGGGIMTLSVARVMGAAILPTAYAPTVLMSDYAGLARLVIDIIIEAFPADSAFWNLQPYFIDAILAAAVKFCFIWTLATGDPMSWMAAIWMFVSLLMGFFM